MRYLSVCSGIEAASVAWHHLGWTPAGFSEVDPFPSAVLKHRFPNTPNFGDMTQHESWPIQPGDIDILVGGTPCQSFSVAGLRQGLADPRGNLMLTYLAIADRLRPKYLVWENVPGVLSSNRGRDFGTFLGALGQLGYGWAYRVLDAQYVRVGGWPRAVPQRRRRVFVVGCLGDWVAPREILALREGLLRNLETVGKARKVVASNAEVGSGSGCCGTVSSKWAKGTGGPAGDECYNLIAQPTAYRWQNDRDGLQQDNVVAALRASQGASGFHEMNHPVITQPVPFTKAKRAQSTSDDETWVDGQVNPTLSLFDQGDTRATTVAVAHAFYSTGGTHGVNQHPEVLPAVKVGSGLGIPSPPAVAQSTTVRRLMPIEVERLQGFPDNWTMIPYRGKPADQCPDGPRYKALGNSMACNVMAWIGEKIAEYEKATTK